MRNRRPCPQCSARRSSIIGLNDSSFRRRQRPHRPGPCLWISTGEVLTRTIFSPWTNLLGRPGSVLHRSPGRPRGNEDLTSWLEYCAEGLHQTLEKVWQRIQQWRPTWGTGNRPAAPPRAIAQFAAGSGGASPREIWVGSVFRTRGDGFAASVDQIGTGKADRHFKERTLCARLSYG